jgi:glutathione S-transferase
LHKTFGLLFRPTTPEEFKTLSREFLGQRFDGIDKQLGRQSDGRQVHCADAYLFTVLRWSPRVGVDLSKWPNITAYLDRGAARCGSDEGGRVAAITAERAADEQKSVVRHPTAASSSGLCSLSCRR